MIGVITCKSFTKENRQNILHCEIPFLDLFAWKIFIRVKLSKLFLYVR